MFYRLGKFPRRFPGREPFEVFYMRLKRAIRNRKSESSLFLRYGIECNGSPVTAGHTVLKTLSIVLTIPHNKIVNSSATSRVWSLNLDTIFLELSYLKFLKVAMLLSKDKSQIWLRTKYSKKNISFSILLYLHHFLFIKNVRKIILINYFFNSVLN